MEKGQDRRGRHRSEFWTVNDEPSKTIQSDAVEADIKTILSRHGVTGIVEHLNAAELRYGDVTQFEDYADMMRQVKAAETAFMQLPGEVRKVFGDDVAKWLDSANDGLSDDQVAKLQKLGFLDEAADGALTEVKADGTEVPVPPADLEPPVQPAV